jgi:hypothetical protein
MEQQLKQYRSLILDKAVSLADPELAKLKNDIFSRNVELPKTNYEEFSNTVHHWITSNTSNTLTGLDVYHREVCVGVTSFIDNLIMRHGIDNLQIFEHDYTYYSRLSPSKSWATVGNLTPNKPLLIALPFPGEGDVHPDMQAILNEALEKNIPVHIDASWMSSATNIQFDFDHPVIESVAFSLSKGLALDWNRIGVRYSKRIDETDSITIANKFVTVNSIDVSVGMLYINNFPQSYLWEKYGSLYHEACRTFLLKPTKCIHMAKHFSTGAPCSFRDVFLACSNTQ